MQKKNFERQAGIPDRYVSGGHWIEFKVMAVHPKVNKRKIPAAGRFTPLQRRFLIDWDVADKCFVFIVFLTESKRYMLMERGSTFFERGKSGIKKEEVFSLPVWETTSDMVELLRKHIT